MREMLSLALSSRQILPSNIIEGKGGRGGNWAYGQSRVILNALCISHGTIIIYF